MKNIEENKALRHAVIHKLNLAEGFTAVKLQ
jgi:hypothetical protein